MSTTVAQLTIEEFLAIPDRDDVKIELVEGEVVEVGRANFTHEMVKSRLNVALAVYVNGNRELALFPESFFILGARDGYIPDLSLVRVERLQSLKGKTFFEGVPDLAIEIVSSEPASKLEAKVKTYLRGGAKAVWAVFPALKCVRVYTAGGASQVVEEGSALEAQDLLPGFRLPAAEIFAEL